MLRVIYAIPFFGRFVSRQTVTPAAEYDVTCFDDRCTTSSRKSQEQIVDNNMANLNKVYNFTDKTVLSFFAK